ncbi:MAG: outer membrane beta-barrel protein [Planctomycetia bacterium]|nr:outer membrane beta-barrel protein [Planctomycetia bacterium]
MKRIYFTIPGCFLGSIILSLVFGHNIGWAAETVLPLRSVTVAKNTQNAVLAPEEVSNAPAAPVAAEEVLVEESYFTCEECTPRRVKFGGWVETGIYGNSHGATTQFYPEGGGMIENSGNSDRLGKLQSTGWQIQQAWLYAERELEKNRCGFDWGFRVDAMFGTDAPTVQCWDTFDANWNTGSEYGFALPQAYFELGFNRLSVKIGKFMTPLGYESITAPDMMFYSHSYLYQHEPSTHCGALFTFDVNSCLSVYAGITTGADTSWDNKYEDVGILLGFESQLTEKLAMGYGFMWNEVHSSTEADADMRRYDSPGMWDGGSFSQIHAYYNNYGIPENMTGNEILHSLYFTWNITQRLTYGLQLNYGNVTGMLFEINSTLSDETVYEQFGVCNYFDYQLQDNLTASLRLEWFRQNAREDISSWVHQNVYEVTFALNYTPCDWLIIRPEIRYDKIFGEGKEMFNGGNDSDQISGGLGVIVKF